MPYKRYGRKYYILYIEILELNDKQKKFKKK